MKRIILNRIIALLFLSTILSCNNNFLEVAPSSEYSEDAVWSDPALIEPFVSSMYSANFGMPYADRQLSDFSDESRSTWSTTYNFNKSLMSPDGLQEWESGFGPEATLPLRWQPLYANVRRENIFFSKIGSVQATTDADKALVERLKGEVYFNRALTYHLLTALYGGVPIITKAYTLSDSFTVARNTYQECIDFITGQLDSAAAYLPLQNPADLQGHATKGAALALKSRVLLYAASDLHNSEKNGIVSDGYPHPELLGYTQGNAADRWKAAKDAAKAVIDLGLYDLYKKDPAPTDYVAQNFIDYFSSYGGNEEDILLQYFTPTYGGAGYVAGVVSDPNGYNCWGNQTPLQELVDDYEMSDGSKFSWTNPAEKENPYENREPRFYATVLYEGKQYRKRPSGYQTIDPFDKIQVGKVYHTSGKLLVAGIDTRDGPVNTANGGYTGYYNRKMTDTTVEAEFVRQDIPFRQFRYAEVLLNYAEACTELGEYAEARTYIDMIRHRAGLPDLPGTLTGNALLQACRHERRIELAFENFRFWDIRRWLIGKEVIHQTHAIDIRYTTDQNASTYRRSDGSTWGKPVYKVIETPGDLRIWENKDYFFPIMRDEMNKNTKLIQNPGY
ncbi:RagB/SusD family nutrient uptake outer membrane protein [Compostibacter hankyongensis]|uniref:RagB/SusD family nutrient uptake outer membrane protein n=1 Tax=Compostibacter hankyongensis TaxID=1007089 RepID=A0ABP8FJM4_9BACT